MNTSPDAYENLPASVRAVCDRMAATDACTAQAADLLTPHVSDPALYWQALAISLLMDAENVHNIHATHCHDEQCPTCAAIAELNATIDAHDGIQPSGCGCPDHASIPGPVTT